MPFFVPRTDRLEAFPSTAGIVVLMPPAADLGPNGAPAPAVIPPAIFERLFTPAPDVIAARGDPALEAFTGKVLKQVGQSLGLPFEQLGQTLASVDPSTPAPTRTPRNAVKARAAKKPTKRKISTNGGGVGEAAV